MTPKMNDHFAGKRWWRLPLMDNPGMSLDALPFTRREKMNIRLDSLRYDMRQAGIIELIVTPSATYFIFDKE